MERRMHRFYLKAIFYLIGMLVLGVNALTHGKTNDQEGREVVRTPLTEKELRNYDQAVKKNEEDKKNNSSLVIKRQQETSVPVTDSHFLPKTKKLMGKKKDYERYYFTVIELESGEIFIEGERMAFLPFEKITLDKKDVWLLLPVSHKDAQKNGFSTVYSATFYDYANSESYFRQMDAFYEYYEKKVLSKASLEGLAMYGWEDEQIVFWNMDFLYRFEPYSSLEDDGKTIFRKADGTPVSDYMKLPHDYIVDQLTSWEKTAFRY